MTRSGRTGPSTSRGAMRASSRERSTPSNGGISRRDARDWLLGAVPFVAGLFARGPEFQKEFAERLPAELLKYSRARQGHRRAPD